MPERRLHEGCFKARRAADTAASTSGDVAAKTEHMSCSVLGVVSRHHEAVSEKTYYGLTEAMRPPPLLSTN